MRWARRRLVVLSVSLLAVVALSAPARAALFLVFETRSYTPPGYVVARTGGIGAAGDLVSARTGGRGAMGESEAMPVFLAAGGIFPNVDSPAALEAAKGVTRVGELRADDAGTGHLQFRVPEFPPGRHELIGFCPQCASLSAGQVIVPLAPFRVVGGAAPIPATTPAPRSVPLGVIVAGAATGVALLAVAVAWNRRRRGAGAVSHSRSPDRRGN